VTETHEGLTRREALKRGAIVAGTLWAVPIVQAVGMRPAYAATPSPIGTGCEVYCIKWVVNQNYIDGTTWGTKWTPLGSSGNPVLSCPEGGLNSVPPEADDIVVSYDSTEMQWVVELPPNCRLFGQDPSPDEFSPDGAAAKCNGGDDNHVPGTGSQFGDTVRIPSCDPYETLHLELILDCCQSVPA
jgi:hypothetical protein